MLLKNKLYGKSSEKVENKEESAEESDEEKEDKNEGELEHVAGIECQAADPDSLKDDKKKHNYNAKRKKLPEHLERIELLLNPDPKCPECGNADFEKISDDISETLEYIPSRFKVIKNIRPRCKCTKCSKIVQAEVPSKAIDKGMAGPGLLSHVLISKYCDHLPLYRQSQIYERENIFLSTSTLCGWVSYCGKLLDIVAEEIRNYVFRSSQIHGDDTPVKVLSPGNGKTKTGRVWGYVVDGRPHGDKSPLAACYFYSPNRKSENPEEHLKDYVGVMHADAYSGYNNLYISSKNENATITEAGCWAHARRKFYEITLVSNNANIAFETIDRIDKIYDTEREIRGSPPDIRKKVRTEQIKEMVFNLFDFWRKIHGKLPQKSRTARAIKYCFNNENALKRFLDDGKIEIDNNAAERALRSIAVGRKNWMFAGSDQGGKNTATICTIIETAKMNGINPWQYLQKLLTVIQDHNSSKISELLPWNLSLN